MSGPVTQTGSEASKGVDAFPDEAVDSDAVPLGLILRPLQRAKQASRSGNGDGNEAEAAENGCPFLGVDALEAGQFFEDLG